MLLKIHYSRQVPEISRNSDTILWNWCVLGPQVRADGHVIAGYSCSLVAHGHSLVAHGRRHLSLPLANLIEKATQCHVTLLWNLSRNPDQISSKILRKKLQNSTQNMKTIGNSIFIREKMLTIFGWNFEIWAVQKYVNLVDLVKSFPTSIYLQKSASIQPRTSLSKFGGKFNSSFIRLLRRHRLEEALGLRRRMNNELNFPPNVERLVLGCIDADFCK